MDSKVLLIYFFITVLPFIFFNLINGLIHKTLYYKLDKHTGTFAQILSLIGTISLVLAILKFSKVFAESIERINPIIALILFLSPFLFYKSYLGYLEASNKHYQKSKNNRVNWGRAFLIAVLVVVGIILASLVAFSG